MKKICPKCRKEYSELENYCSKCGIELEREQLKVLQREINNLTKQQREVLYLKYYKKMSSDEIAQVMGLTSRTVYNTTHTAISRLREQLSKTFLLAVGANLWIFN